MAENVKVAVRVRPFNSREKTRNAALIIQMNGKTTEIKDPSVPSQEPKKFTFDFSYWSHDGFKERSDGYLEPTNPKYADQSKVFEDLGQGVIANAWEGYNCSLFAYGQTGSGKSYSMVGYGANKGIIPIFCEDLFNGIEDKKKTDQTTEFQVTLSMLEIYNEQVWDLLNPGSKKKGGLKIRQHPSKGFYVESLVTVPVKSYEDIDLKIQEGTKSRTVAATNMNATSSRAHTIVAINFVQKTKKENTQGMTKSSIVNLVDLAGSERADSTGATGDRLKEGSAINLSLSTLGNCIKALADQSTGKKNVIVPYRDSVLTRLLKNALGGNSKTIMIAALSPADINFEETLSTLRFADRAKAIKTKAVINESPTEKLIRELREENQRLMEQLKAGGVVYVEAPQGAQPTGVTDEEVEEMKKEMEEQLKRNQNEMEQMKKSWEERLMETENIYKAKEEKEKKQKEMRKTTAHFWNLNEDPQLSNMIHHFVTSGKHRIGNRKASPPADITLSGLSILSEHAIVSHEGNTIILTPKEDAKVLVNGKPLKEQSVLHHNDRVMFGSSNLFVLHHPAELQEAQKKGVRLEEVTYDLAQEEIAENSGFDMGKTGGKSRDDLLLQEDLMKIVPMINEANAMSEELNKKVKFEVALVSPQARGLKDGRTEVLVKMKSKMDDAEWVWDKNKFMNRKFIMQEMYQNYVEGEEWDVEKERDPFWEPDDAEVMIGTVHVYLQSLGYMIEMEESLAITDHKGNELGHLQVEAFPCDKEGNEDVDDFVEDPQELIGNSLYFNLRIPHARGLPQRFGKGETYVKYKFYLDKEPTITNTISGTINPNFNHEKFFSFVPVTQQFVKYLANQAFVIEVWGRQTGRKVSRGSPAPTSTGHKTTKEKPRTGTELVGTKSSAEKNNTLANGELASASNQNMKLELNKAIRRGNRMEKKLKLLRETVQDAKRRNQESVSVDLLDSILYSGKGDKFKAVSNILLQTRKHTNRQRPRTNTSSACVIT